MRRNYLQTLLVVLFALSVLPGNGQVMLNEISNANGATVDDELEKSEDWIELYNMGSSPVNLQNYALSNDPDEPRKWVFPNVTIPAYGFLLVYASGRDAFVNNTFLHASFKLKREGFTVIFRDPNNAILDQKDLTFELQADHAIGRGTDGSGSWCVFNVPTPRGSNNSSACYAGYEPDPVFSIEGGFFSSGQAITLTAPTSTGTIRYTFNDKEPNAFSAAYSGPVNVSSTVVLAARTFSNTNNLPSHVVKNTYMVNEQGLGGLPVFSLTTDSLNLWSQDSGIYVLGPNADTAYPYFGANYWQKEWERKCHIEYYDEAGNKHFETAAGLKIFGGYSRVFDQKSFKVKFRNKYGLASIKEPLIDEKPQLDEFHDLLLRNGGSDNMGTRFRDALMQRLVKSPNVDYMAYKPGVVFLNGQYWGEYEIRERQDAEYIERNYGIPVEDIDFLSHEGVVIEWAGSDTGFYNMFNYMTTANPADPGFYDYAAKRIDIENYTDYFVSETFYGNTDWVGDWVNNIRYWRVRDGGKWRYILWDLDWGYGLFLGAHTDFLSRARYPMVPNEQSDIFNAMLSNDQYKNYFVDRYADMINTYFQTSNVRSLAESMRDEIDPAMPRHCARWNMNYNYWLSEVQDVVNWNEQRIGYARTQIQQHFGLAGQVDVELDVYPAGAGKVKISTVTPTTYPWTGVYFNGVPVTITAMANPGYSFDHWEAPALNTSATADRSVTLNIANNEKFVAHFTPGDGNIVAYPNPFIDNLELEYTVPTDGAVSVKLYSIIGKEAATIVPEGTFKSAGEHTLSLNLGGYSLADGVYFIELTGPDFNKTLRVVKTTPPGQ
jgi:hypothetical protein